jgi:hypothetical protein
MGDTNRIISTESSTIFRTVVTKLPEGISWAGNKYSLGEARLFETPQGAKSFKSYLDRHGAAGRVDVGYIEWSLLL